MTTFQCKECGAEVKLVKLVECELVRTCEHKDAPILASMTAHATGESKVAG